MDYKKYIELGFIRTDMDDPIELGKTGFGGFTLVKVLTSTQSIEVSSGELTMPKLYIRKRNTDTYHIINISEECVIDLCYYNSLL